MPASSYGGCEPYGTTSRVCQLSYHTIQGAVQPAHKFKSSIKVVRPRAQKSPLALVLLGLPNRILRQSLYATFSLRKLSFLNFTHSGAV